MKIFSFSPSLALLSLLTILISHHTLSTTAVYTGPGKPYASANCIIQSTSCSRYTSNRSGVCRPATSPDSQPSECKMAACEFCRSRTRDAHRFCLNANMIKLCRSRETTKPPSTTTRGGAGSSSGCTWTAKASQSYIVIDLSRKSPATGWTAMTRSRGPVVEKGIIYEKDLGGGTDPKGEKGLMCFPVRASTAGNYVFTAISYAPHWTEHNDAWVKSSKGFSLIQGDVTWRDAPADEWHKGYQNNNGFGDYLSTKDHDGHKFVIKGVSAGETFKVCISGRSYKFEMYRLIMTKCSRSTCNEGFEGLYDLSPSQCL